MKRNVQPSSCSINAQKIIPSSTCKIRNGHVATLEGSSSQVKELLFAKTDITIVGLLERLDMIMEQCSKAQAAGGGPCMHEAKFQMSKELLTNEARKMVTASKLLVKSVTDADAQDLPENLSCCLGHLNRLTELASDATSHTTTPLQTRNLVGKVRDVAVAFRDTMTSALSAIDVQENVLLCRAENLASVLAALLRSLRVFTP